jgi:hypothetical protein
LSNLPPDPDSPPDSDFAITNVDDPGSGAFLTPGSGMGKKSRSGSEIQDEHPGYYPADNISESLETIF